MAATELGAAAAAASAVPNPAAIALIIVAAALVWVAFDSWIVIDAQRVGVVLRFGKFERIIHNGLNLKWPAPIETVIQVETTSQQVSDEVRMLTKDENIVQINFTVQYQVVDAQKYKFAATQPADTLKQAAESAVRQVIGGSDMDTILSSHGSDVVGETKKLLQQTLDAYGVGLNVNEINFQNLLPPHEVKDAFDDVNNASNNQKQLINDAQAYAAKVVPLARGEAARILADAQGLQGRPRCGSNRRCAALHARRRSVSGGTGRDAQAPVSRHDAAGAGAQPEGGRPEQREKYTLSAARQSQVGRGGERGYRLAGRARQWRQPVKFLTPIVALLLVVLIVNSAFIVREGESALLLQFGRIQGDTGNGAADYKPGLHFKIPLIQQVVRFDRRMLNLEAQPERYFDSGKNTGQCRFLRQVADRESGCLLSRFRCGQRANRREQPPVADHQGSAAL